MSKKTRLIIVLVCVACFLVFAPVLVAYSMGYRFDFEKMKIVATGGIYVRSFPTAEQIYIDNNAPEKPGMFGNSIFAQSLLPKDHTVLIKKNGYYDYYKTLPVQENLASKLENVLLFKKDIPFTNLLEKIYIFSIAPNNQNIITATVGTKGTTFNYFSLNNAGQKKTFLIAQAGEVSDIKWADNSNSALIEIKTSINTFYFLFDTTLANPSATRLSYLDKNSTHISFNPQNNLALFFIKNNTLYSAKGNSALPEINNIIAYKISGANIVWLSTKGALYSSDFSGKLLEELTVKSITVDRAQNYQINIVSEKTFVQSENATLVLNSDKKILESFEAPITNYKVISAPNNKNLIYWNSEKIYLYVVADKRFEQIFSGNAITNCQWFNNDYIVFNSGDKVIISEIDYRGNINAVTLPSTATSMFFNTQDNKLYILNQETLSVSEKLVP